MLGLIKGGIDSGARLVTGGGVPENLPTGYYVQPTLLADVDPNSQVAQEEIFGPVLAVTPYDSDDEAVAIANNSIYGLSGEVSGGDVDRAFEVAKRMRTGNVKATRNTWKPRRSACRIERRDCRLRSVNSPTGVREAHLYFVRLASDNT